jgi:citrate synthase
MRFCWSAILTREIFLGMRRDGIEGTIQYRGYSIHDVIGKKGWVDVSHLLIWGKWPSGEEAEAYQRRLNSVPTLHEKVLDVIRAFP